MFQTGADLDGEEPERVVGEGAQDEGGVPRAEPLQRGRDEQVSGGRVLDALCRPGGRAVGAARGHGEVGLDRGARREQDGRGRARPAHLLQDQQVHQRLPGDWLNHGRVPHHSLVTPSYILGSCGELNT